MLIENSSSAAMWTQNQDFIKFNTQFGSLIQGIRSTLFNGGGTLRIWVQDDQGHDHEFIIQDAIYILTSLANLFCPQQWARQCKCNLGNMITHCDTKGNHLLMEWSNDQGTTVHRKRVPLITAMAPRYLWFKAFAVIQRAFLVGTNVISDSSNDESEANQQSKSEGARKSNGEVRTNPKLRTPVNNDLQPFRFEYLKVTSQTAKQKMNCSWKPISSCYWVITTSEATYCLHN